MIKKWHRTDSVIGVHFLKICIHGRLLYSILGIFNQKITFYLVGINLSGWVVLIIYFLPSINKTLINIFIILMFEQCRMCCQSEERYMCQKKSHFMLFKFFVEQFMKICLKGIDVLLLDIFLLLKLINDQKESQTL